MNSSKRIAMICLVAIPMLLVAACDIMPGARDPLAGTSWELMSLSGTRPIAGTTITAEFANGQVRGSAGCNSYSGSYQVKGDEITVGAIAMTEMACLDPKGAMDQEQVFAGMLADAQTFRLSEGQLQIMISDGEALTFVPQE